MAEAHIQNRGETEGSARASAANKMAECQGDRDAVQKQRMKHQALCWGQKQPTAEQVRACFAQPGMALPGVAGLQRRSRRDEERLCFPYAEWLRFFPHHRAPLGALCATQRPPTPCTSWRPERIPHAPLLRDVKRKGRPQKIWQSQA